MNAELRAIGKTAMVPAPFARGFEIGAVMNTRWFASDTARKIADAILSYQAPNGGWSKHVSYDSGARARGQSYFSESAEWQWISTIDNSSTTEQMRFLVLADSVKPDERYKTAYTRGLEYLMAAQFPNGCWPQVWPLMGGYHDAATLNDDALTNALMTFAAGIERKSVICVANAARSCSRRCRSGNYVRARCAGEGRRQADCVGTTA
jgi:hypothetical protein